MLALDRTIREGAGDTLFRASKRGLHWLALSDSGAGLALLATDVPLLATDVPLLATDVPLLATDVPLLGRADMTGTTLFASRESAGDYGLSRQWVADHAIHAVKGKSLSGAFILRAFILRAFILRAFSASGVTAAALK